MALGTSVGDNKEVLVDVEISAPGHPGHPAGEGMQTTKRLMVDTGSKLTIIPLANVMDMFLKTILAPGPIEGNIKVGGVTKPKLKILNGTMTVEVGDPLAIGPPPANQPRTCHKIWATPGGIKSPSGFVGVLGRDQLKELKADSRMNIPETRAWLEPRPPR